MTTSITALSQRANVSLFRDLITVLAAHTTNINLEVRLDEFADWLEALGVATFDLSPMGDGTFYARHYDLISTVHGERFVTVGLRAQHWDGHPLDGGHQCDIPADQVRLLHGEVNQ